MRTVDLARVGDTYFATVLASGLDSKVNERANDMVWPRGQMRYNLATLAEEDHVVAGEDGVLELGQDGVVIAQHAGEERLTRRDPGDGRSLHAHHRRAVHPVRGAAGRVAGDPPATGRVGADPPVSARPSQTQRSSDIAIRR